MNNHIWTVVQAVAARYNRGDNLTDRTMKPGQLFDKKISMSTFYFDRLVYAQK